MKALTDALGLFIVWCVDTEELPCTFSLRSLLSICSTPVCSDNEHIVLRSFALDDTSFDGDVMAGHIRSRAS